MLFQYLHLKRHQLLTAEKKKSVSSNQDKTSKSSQKKIHLLQNPDTFPKTKKSQERFPF